MLGHWVNATPNSRGHLAGCEQLSKMFCLCSSVYHKLNVCNAAVRTMHEQDAPRKVYSDIRIASDTAMLLSFCLWLSLLLIPLLIFVSTNPLFISNKLILLSLTLYTNFTSLLPHCLCTCILFLNFLSTGWVWLYISLLIDIWPFSIQVSLFNLLSYHLIQISYYLLILPCLQSLCHIPWLVLLPKGFEPQVSTLLAWWGNHPGNVHLTYLEIIHASHPSRAQQQLQQRGSCQLQSWLTSCTQQKELCKQTAWHGMKQHRLLLEKNTVGD